VISRQALISQLESESAESARFTARVRGYSAAFGAIMQILGALDQMDQAQRMLHEGTLFGDAQRRADALADRGTESVTAAEEITDNISLFAATAAVGDALQAGDTETLGRLSSSLGDITTSLQESAAPLQQLSDDLRRRSQAADVLVDFYGRLMQLPTDPMAGTVPQAQAFTMHESLQQFSGACRRGADSFGNAASILTTYAQWTAGLASRAQQGYVSGVLRSAAEAERRAAASRPAAPAPQTQSHQSSTLQPPLRPAPSGFPTVREQQGTVCPNCHRPVGADRSRSPLSNVGLGTGPGGQMTDDDLRRMRQWLEAGQQ
jgi:hypothetical protein